MIDIIKLAKEKNIFKRNKIPIDIKIIAALLYHSGLSYRNVSKFGNFSHESVRLWYNALNKILPKPDKRYRRAIAIDETKTKIGRDQIFM
jgi:transposase-like protein